MNAAPRMVRTNAIRASRTEPRSIRAATATETSANAYDAVAHLAVARPRGGLQCGQVHCGDQLAVLQHRVPLRLIARQADPPAGTARAGNRQLGVVGFPVGASVLGYTGGDTRIYLRTDPSQATAVQGVLAATANPAEPNAVQVGRPSDVLIARAAATSALGSLVLGLGAGALLIGGVRRGQRHGHLGAGAARRDRPAARSVQPEARSAPSSSPRRSCSPGLAPPPASCSASPPRRDTRPQTAQPTAIPATAVRAGLGAALAVGALAGLYPALRAARLAPADALRTLRAQKEQCACPPQLAS